MSRPRSSTLAGSAAVLAALLAAAVTGCSGSSTSPTANQPALTVASTPSATAPATPTDTPFAAAPPLAENPDWANQLENFGAAKFSTPTRVDNRWYPLAAGTQFVYEGFTEDKGVRKPHRFVQTVTDLTKPIMGVDTVVVWDQDFSDGALAEAEIAFNAQSDAGDVWRLGEYPQVYEDGEIVETPTWIAGIAGAQAGITIHRDPVLGGPSWSQGWSPVVPWTDRARVAQVGVQECVRFGCYRNGIVTEEFNREEPGAVQLKYYAPGIGNTRVSFTGTDQTKETLELVSVTTLDAAGLTQAREAALALDRSGFQRSRAVYALTMPARQRSA